MLSLNEYRNDYRLTMNYQGVSREEQSSSFVDAYQRGQIIGPTLFGPTLLSNALSVTGADNRTDALRTDPPKDRPFNG